MSDSFRLTVRRTTIADMQRAAAGTRKEQRLRHPGYRVRIDGDRLKLRYAGSGYTRSAWRLVARLEERSYGVVVTGTMRRTVAVLSWWWLIVVGVILTAAGVGIASADGAAHPGTWITLTGGPALVLIGLLNLMLDSIMGIGDAADARRLLRELFEPPEPEPEPATRGRLRRFLTG